MITNFDITFTMMLIWVVGTLVLLVVAGGTFLKVHKQHAQEVSHLRNVENRLHQSISELESRQQHKIVAIGNTVSLIKSDVELLAGEWSVRQAIELAAEGVDPLNIERETGLSSDDVKAMLRVRTH